MLRHREVLAADGDAARALDLAVRAVSVGLLVARKFAWAHRAGRWDGAEYEVVYFVVYEGEGVGEDLFAVSALYRERVLWSARHNELGVGKIYKEDVHGALFLWY